MKKLFRLVDGNDNVFINKLVVDIHSYTLLLDDLEREAWSSSVYCVPKLRTYIQYKGVLGTENFVKQIISKRRRSIFAQFRCGILPLKVETGRYNNIPIEHRLCELCESNSIENEMHFLLHCDHYSGQRAVLFEDALKCYPQFMYLTDVEQLTLLMQSQNVLNSTARYLSSAMESRSSSLSVDVSWRV